MLTLSSWYPNIDLNESFYEDDSFRIGVNGQNYYLISKLDKTLIVYERSHPQKIRTFIDFVSVDSLRYNSFKRLYNELGETSGSGRSRLIAAEIRFRLENPSVQAEYVPSLAEMHRHEIEVLKSDKLVIESRYDPAIKAYSIYCHRTISDGDTLTTSVEQKTISEHKYDVNFIFNFVFYSEFSVYPKKDFIERLRELSILAENEPFTLEHVKVYEMSVI